MINPKLMAIIQNDIDRWERPIYWMYLDSEGNVTVGSGTMLPDVASAKAIKFFHEKTFLPATTAEIGVAWKRLHHGANAQKAALPKKKYSALHYKSLDDLRITKHTSKTLRDSQIIKDYTYLKQIYPKFDTFPDNAKVALFDMIYNIGPGKSKTQHHRAAGLRQYVLMNAAINKGDWMTAANQCHRRGIPIARNKMTADLFKSCSKHHVYNPVEMLNLKYA